MLLGDAHLPASREGPSVRSRVRAHPQGSQACQLLPHGGGHRQDRGKLRVRPCCRIRLVVRWQNNNMIAAGSDDDTLLLCCQYSVCFINTMVFWFESVGRDCVCAVVQSRSTTNL